MQHFIMVKNGGEKERSPSSISSNSVEVIETPATEMTVIPNNVPDESSRDTVLFNNSDEDELSVEIVNVRSVVSGSKNEVCDHVSIDSQTNSVNSDVDPEAILPYSESIDSEVANVLRDVIDRLIGCRSTEKANEEQVEGSCEDIEDDCPLQSDDNVELDIESYELRSGNTDEPMDDDLVVEDQVKPHLSVSDEAVVSSETTSDLIIKDEVNESVDMMDENDFGELTRSASSNNANYSVDFLDNGQYVAKTEIEIEEPTSSYWSCDSEHAEAGDSHTMDLENVGESSNDSATVETNAALCAQEYYKGIETGDNLENGNSTRPIAEIKKEDLGDKSGQSDIDTFTSCHVTKKRRVYQRTGKWITNDPRYLLPLEQGWTREVVFRSGDSRKMADVYYYPPIGRKLRSTREVDIYLQQYEVVGLKISNFSFAKQVLNTPNEIVRTAKKKGDTGLDSLSLPQMKKHKAHNNTPSSADTLFAIRTMPTRKMRKSAVVNTPSVNNMPVEMATSKLELPPCNKIDDNILLSNDEQMRVDHHYQYKCDSAVPIDPQRCTDRCPGQEGIIPLLHCNKCLCLFHPRCVGISDLFSGSPNFTCQECGGGEVNLKKQIETSLVRLMAPNEAEQWTTNNYSVTNPDVFGDQQAAVPSGDGVQLPPPAAFHSSSHSTILPKATPDFGNVKRFPCGVTIEKVNPGTRTSDGGSSEQASASISVIPVTKSPTFNQNNDPPFYHPNQPRLPVIDRSSKGILRPVVIPSSDSACSLPKNAVMKYTTPMRPRAARRRQKTWDTRSVIPQIDTRPELTQSLPVGLLKTHEETPDLASKLTTSSELPAKPAQKSQVPHQGESSQTNSTNSTMNSLNCGIRSLIAIFKYLTVGDVLRASAVCHAWRVLATHPTVWETVVLKNVKVTDWNAFARSAKSHCVRHLDARGVLVDGISNSAYEGLLIAVTSLTDLRRLTLGATPLAIIYAAANRLPHLQHFSAEWIMETNKDMPGRACMIDFSQFSSMHKLESLRLRGFYGLEFSKVNGGFLRITDLKQLTCLVITSVKNVPSYQFLFLNELSNLTTLHMGECVNWKEDVYAAIGRMTNLANLRLEFGGEFCECGLQVVLPSLLNLVRLELIIFRIPSNFGDLLKPLKKLQQLTVWPELKYKAEQNNYYTVKAMEKISFIKIMTWGLVMSHLDSEMAVYGQMDHNSCCIPYLSCEPANGNAVLQSTKIQISAHELMNKLRTEMPHSKVQVIMVPNESYSTICYMPR